MYWLLLVEFLCWLLTISLSLVLAGLVVLDEINPLGLQVELVVPGGIRLPGIQAELVVPNGFTWLVALGGFRSPGMQVEPWPEKSKNSILYTVSRR